MLMAWGPFRFTVPNYSVETIRRSLEARNDRAAQRPPHLFKRFRARPVACL